MYLKRKRKKICELVITSDRKAGTQHVWAQSRGLAQYMGDEELGYPRLSSSTMSSLVLLPAWTSVRNRRVHHQARGKRPATSQPVQFPHPCSLSLSRPKVLSTSIAVHAPPSLLSISFSLLLPAPLPLSLAPKVMSNFIAVHAHNRLAHEHRGVQRFCHLL